MVSIALMIEETCLLCSEFPSTYLDYFIVANSDKEAKKTCTPKRQPEVQETSTKWTS